MTVLKSLKHLIAKIETVCNIAMIDVHELTLLTMTFQT